MRVGLVAHKISLGMLLKYHKNVPLLPGILVGITGFLAVI